MNATLRKSNQAASQHVGSSRGSLRSDPALLPLLIAADTIHGPRRATCWLERLAPTAGVKADSLRHAVDAWYRRMEKTWERPPAVRLAPFITQLAELSKVGGVGHGLHAWSLAPLWGLQFPTYRLFYREILAVPLYPELDSIRRADEMALAQQEIGLGPLGCMLCARVSRA